MSQVDIWRENQVTYATVAGAASKFLLNSGNSGDLKCNIKAILLSYNPNFVYFIVGFI